MIKLESDRVITGFGNRFEKKNLKRKNLECRKDLSSVDPVGIWLRMSRWR